MVQIFNSIFPKVCKNGFRTFVPGALEMLTAIRPLLMTILHWHIVCSTVKLLSAKLSSLLSAMALPLIAQQ